MRIWTVAPRNGPWCCLTWDFSAASACAERPNVVREPRRSSGWPVVGTLLYWGMNYNCFHEYRLSPSGRTRGSSIRPAPRSAPVYAMEIKRNIFPAFGTE